MEENKRENKTYYMIIKGSKEVDYDELHLLRFNDIKECIRKKYEIPKDCLKYNPKLEEIFSNFINEALTVDKYNGEIIRR